MIRTIWRRLVRLVQRSPSQQTVDAHRRLEDVRRDDDRVDRTIASANRLMRENHFAPMIAKLFESRSAER